MIVHASSAGKEVSFPTSLVVHAAGRTADIEDLQLDKINVEFDKKGLQLTSICKVSVMKMYMLAET